MNNPQMTPEETTYPEQIAWLKNLVQDMGDEDWSTFRISKFMLTEILQTLECHNGGW